METTDRIAEFKAFFNEHMESERTSIEAEANETAAFLDEYPLARIRELSFEEYCLGTEKSKDSFCYSIEFGKYKYTGFGIGGATAKKYGVYYSKTEQCFKHGSVTIENIELFWPQFRDELYRFLIESGKSDHPVRLEEYPLLQGMAMVLTKLLCLYYPDLYFTITAIRQSSSRRCSMQYRSK